MIMATFDRDGAAAYQRLRDKIARDECIVLDGAIGTELQRQNVQGFRLSDSSRWGFEVVDQAPHAVVNVHKSYLLAGCDVVTTDTYAVLDAPEKSADLVNRWARPVHWMDMARKAVLLARDAVKGCGKVDQCAVAFSIGGDIVTEQQLGTVKLLLRAFEDAAPDLVLFETLSMLTENHTQAAVEMIIDSGLPVWLSLGFLGLAGWTVAAAHGYVAKPGRYVRYLITLCAPLLVFGGDRTNVNGQRC